MFKIVLQLAMVFCNVLITNNKFCLIFFNIQPGHRDGTIQCFIKRDKSNLIYHLLLCLSPGKLSLLTEFDLALLLMGVLKHKRLTLEIT